MISAKSTRFKYINRNKKNSIVFIPGWATDHRIFKPLDLDFNYIYPVRFCLFDFEKGLLETLVKDKIKRTSFFGWSLGGFLAADIASRHKDIIDRLILVSVRKRYTSEEIDLMRENLKKDKKATLNKFYNLCFPNKEKMFWFKENLLEDYCQNFDLNYLLDALNYLENTEISPDLLKDIERTKIIHGRLDMIAPIREVIELKNSLPQIEFINIKDEGHIPFLRKEFNTFI